MHPLPSDKLASLSSAVIDPAISLSNYLPLDLSADNPEIITVNSSSSEDWERYINELLRKNNKKVAYGGYLEKRNLYKRSEYFNSSENDRNIHLGVDFWIAAGTSVHAFTDGKIHSFQDNQNYGDYGPTIILEHNFEGHVFFTLYGHLSRASLEKLTVGKRVASGEKIAELGKASVNGDYAPHLHFQLILDLEGKTGDYPGVCSESEVPKYALNCPDPLPLLGIESSLPF